MIVDELEGQTITIPVRQFVDLYVAQQQLTALEHGSVKDWYYYDDAMAEADFDECVNKRELIQQLKQEGIICEK